jgi:polar amino acid transport system substrate-binding protein
MSKRASDSARTRGWRRLVGVVAAVTTVTVVAGCAAGSTPGLPSVPTPKASTAAPAASVAPLAGCSDTNSTRLASYAPTGALPAPTALPPGSTMAKIRARGRLIVGVSADNLLFGFRNPIKGDLEGFDIDMVNAVAAAIFGTASGHVEYRVLTFAQRIPALTSGQVDLVADIMTINCARWAQVAFSAEYFKAGQQVLVRQDSKATGIDDLDGKKVCSAIGSTGSQTLTQYPKVKAVLVNDISDCLVLFQQGSVDGIISDNTVVDGFRTQDPYAMVIGKEITDEPYGLAMPKQNIDFVQFVNALLIQMRATGAWTAIYKKWIPADVASAPGDSTQPTPVYGRA